MRRWIWHIRLWGRLIFGGREVVGSGMFLSHLYFHCLIADSCRDVAAGVAILLEAGGLVTTANPPENPDTAPVEDFRLGSRLYLAIRYVLVAADWDGYILTLYSPAGPSKTETGRQTQERTVREVWRRVRQLEYSRPGA